jgi:hypothetical protein
LTKLDFYSNKFSENVNNLSTLRTIASESILVTIKKIPQNLKNFFSHVLIPFKAHPLYNCREGSIAQLVECPPTGLKVGGLNHHTGRYFLSTKK